MIRIKRDKKSQWIQKVRRYLATNLPGVFIAGSSYEGVGIPDCIGQAEQVVKQTLSYLN